MMPRLMSDQKPSIVFRMNRADDVLSLAVVNGVYAGNGVSIDHSR